MSPLKKPGVSFEMTKTDVLTNADFSFFTINYSASARIRLGNNLFGLIEIPYAHIGYKDTWYDWSGYPYEYEFHESTLGNPYIGAEIGGQSSGPFLRIGTRVPLTDEKKDWASSFGQTATVDWPEVFAADIIAIQTAFGCVIASQDEYRASISLGPNFLLPTDDDYDKEVIADLAVELWGYGRLVQAGIGYHFRYILTQKEWSFGRCAQHQLGVTTMVNIGAFHPGIHFVYPLDLDINRGIKMDYGLNLTVDLPSAE